MGREPIFLTGNQLCLHLNPGFTGEKYYIVVAWWSGG